MVIFKISKMSAKTKTGHFYETTVEIEFNGKKVRVSKDVADAIAKKTKKSKKGE